MIYDIYGRTETGPVRECNEDHILIDGWIKNRGWIRLTLSDDDEQVERTGLLLAVADGMGGNAGGAEASRIALEGIRASMERIIPPSGSANIQGDDLEIAMQQANAAVCAAQTRNPQFANMGTTLSGVLLTSFGYWVLHAGDSRVLRIRGKFLRPLTRDDNLAQQLYEAGVDHKVAATNPEADALLNWVGAEQMRAAIQTGPVLEPGDNLIICSDGLHGVLDEDVIIGCLNDPLRPPWQVGDELIASAIAAGSTDNLSLIVIRLLGDDQPNMRGL